MASDNRHQNSLFVLLKTSPTGGRDGLLLALQYLQVRALLAAVSSFYEITVDTSEGESGALLLVCCLQSDLPAGDFEKFINSVEERMRIESASRGNFGPVQVNILFHENPDGDISGAFKKSIKLEAGSPLWIPLEEITGRSVPPGFSGRSVMDLATTVDKGKIRKIRHDDPGFPIERDVQQGKPRVSLDLSRVGVTNLERIIRLVRNGHRSLFYAQMDLFAWLDRRRAGVHMSRFNDEIERLVEEITLEASSSIEAIAERLAKRIVQSQRVTRSRVNVRAKFPLRKFTPLSRKRVEELYTFIGISACNADVVRTVTGVEVEGMTVCPCAQEMVKSHSMKLLAEEGYDAKEAAKIVDLLPIASHNQRGKGTLLLGTDRSVSAEHLVHLLEASMSSETYELLKRPDEFYVVNKAHRNPKFAEDVVREILGNLVDMYPDLPDNTFVLARQENLESIHQHNAFAERSGTLGAIRLELTGGRPQGRQPSLEEWLESGV